MSSRSSATEMRWSDLVRSAAFLGKQHKESTGTIAVLTTQCRLLALMPLLGNHSTHQLTSPCLQNTSQGSCKVLKEVKSKTSMECGVQDWSWNLYGGHRGWCNMIMYNLFVFAYFSFFHSPIFFSPNNNQECNRNAENQGVYYPGKAVGVKKAFFVVFFFSIYGSRAYWTALLGRFCAKSVKHKTKRYYVSLTVFQWPCRTIK